MPSDHDNEQPDFDQEALYRTVRQAVQDAILDAVGTIALVTIGGAVLLAGASVLLRTATEQGFSVPVLAAGVWMVAIGLYVVASTLGVIQPVRDWV
ncbi:hypothetical protein B4589_001715 [Halolamina sp. CBA1230]|uniref:hypothetical protein n=1 Tax=Halolamina sp. CBA1230 TaxID=1853690 RepID=UPI0009A1F6C5|nr:hypothetical protein [Halolamina sp. CBA1230]QKY19155.1 hypothetical protein B4589_001715 [Halolamina sp. CBA1230]